MSLASFAPLTSLGDGRRDRHMYWWWCCAFSLALSLGWHAERRVMGMEILLHFFFIFLQVILFAIGFGLFSIVFRILVRRSIIRVACLRGTNTKTSRRKGQPNKGWSDHHHHCRFSETNVFL